MPKSRFPNVVVWTNGGVPAAMLLWDAWQGRLGANPVNFAIRTTGLLSLIFLTLSLCITPLRQLSGRDVLIPFRRTLGLYAALYAFAHFVIFFWFDREKSISSTIHEIITRRYIWYGLVALLVFVPLTVTSTGGMIRRLGPKRWKRLHRLVYLAAIGAAVHYLLVNKYVTTQAIVFAAILGGLLLYRTIAAHVLLRRAFEKLKAAVAAAPMQARPKFWKGPLKVAGVFRETSEVQTFRLVPMSGDALPFDYLPGQYLNLVLTIDGRPVRRSYTIASSPTRSGYCELTVKREAMGISSRHLHDLLKPGDAIDVSGPAGKFVFTGEKAESVVLIAGGVGVTPLMSKLRYLTDLCWPGEIYFLFVARTEADIIFHDELAALQRRHPNVHVTIALTRAGPDWRGERGRLTAESMRRVVPDLARREIHVCGPDAMAADTLKLLADLGVAEANIRFESFTPPSPTNARAGVAVAVAGEPQEDASLTFARTGQFVEMPNGKVILEIAEDLGVPIDYDCRAGTCGTCKVRLIGGRVAMESEDALTAADKKDNLILACQARCLDAVTVDA